MHQNEQAAVTTVAPGHPADAFRVTGTSPGRPALVRLPEAARTAPSSPQPSTARGRRSYETVHVLGCGAVGMALLQRFRSDRRRVIAVTDSTGTVYEPRGVDVDSVAAWKLEGRAIRDFPQTLGIPGPSAIAHVDADIVADATSTDLDRPCWTRALDAALGRGACVASAAKAALCEAGAEWLSGEHRVRVGCNAVLGGTGRSLIAELPDLQRRTRAIAIVGNASTTTIIEVIERGGTLEDGLAEANRRGFLEPDPELDLRGADAAVKLAIVAGIIAARRIDPRSIATEDLRNQDAVSIRARARRGATTRLIARLDCDGSLKVRYEEVSRDSILAAPCGRVVYEYTLTRDERRLHIGSGLGAVATAGALFADIRALAGEAAFRAGAEVSR